MKDLGAARLRGWCRSRRRGRGRYRRFGRFGGLFCFRNRSHFLLDGRWSRFFLFGRGGFLLDTGAAGAGVGATGAAGAGANSAVCSRGGAVEAMMRP